MDPLLRELANQVAPLLVQLAATVLIGLLSILAFKAKVWIGQHITPKQEAFIEQVFVDTVHYAEAKGARQLGEVKLKIACDRVDKKLQADGITSIDAEDIIARVQKTWASEIGPN